MPARILIAEEKSVLAAVAQALEGYELLKATTLPEAERLMLEDGIDLFVIGIHLDDSQSMVLVKQIRNKKNHAKTPIVMIRLLPSANAEMLRFTLDYMKTVQGISAYLELENDPRSTQNIRAAVENCLPANLLAKA
jgi:DNA-binding response OmpR family regulator